MTDILETARWLASEGNTSGACRAYAQVIRKFNDQDSDAEMEAALHILQLGGDHRISFDTFVSLYHRKSEYAADCLNILLEAFYLPNVEDLQKQYEKNCKLLAKYPYLFQKDFIPFDELPVLFFPYDDNGYRPFSIEEERFGEYVDFRYPVISRNFFADLDKPILAADVFSQYELEYLNDNVRKSEWVGRENHIYLHYTDWGAFCAYLQVLDFKKLLSDEKIVFLIEDEIEQYPIDFKARFGLDYSQNPVKSIGIREVNRMIWHTQLSSHNGGDFFNEVFDAHPNLLYMDSVMMDDMETMIKTIKLALKTAKNRKEALQVFQRWEEPQIAEELYNLKKRTDKDILVALFLRKKFSPCLDKNSRIVPALFFQPHFHGMVYNVEIYESGAAVLRSEQYDRLRSSPLLKEFKYIKTFTPMRRMTTSYAASIRFAYAMVTQVMKNELEGSSVGDPITNRILNRSYMVDPEDRLFQDSVLVRFEDGKLNPKATFTALAAFVDLPYTESMTYCSFGGKKLPGGIGFSPITVYRKYEEFVGDSERYFLEFFMQDAYRNYGYDLHYYDGAPMDEGKVRDLVESFETRYHYNRVTQEAAIRAAKQKEKGRETLTEAEEQEIRQESEVLLRTIIEGSIMTATMMLKDLRFVNKKGQPLRRMTKLDPDPALMEQPLYH